MDVPCSVFLAPFKKSNEAILRGLNSGDRPAEFQVDFVNEGFTLHRFCGFVDGENVTFRYYSAEIGEMDSYDYDNDRRNRPGMYF